MGICGIDTWEIVLRIQYTFELEIHDDRGETCNCMCVCGGWCIIGMHALGFLCRKLLFFVGR